MQVWPRNKWRKCYSLKLDSNLDRKTSIEINVEAWHKLYLLRITKLGFPDLVTHIYEYLCKVSFLTTLDIYKDYFKSCHKRCKVMQSDNICILWPEAKISLTHHSFCRSYCVFTPRVLWPRSFLIFIVDELKNFAVNILKLVC